MLRLRAYKREHATAKSYVIKAILQHIKAKSKREQAHYSQEPIKKEHAKANTTEEKLKQAANKSSKIFA